MVGDVVISEIMYDLPGTDPGREWVEVYNNSGEPVDFSTFKFFEADTNHKLISLPGKENGEKSIPPRGYALIVSDPEKFKADNPDFFGVIFDSTFSLSNTGEVLILKDQDLNIIDQRSYGNLMGGAGDGNSIQLVDGSWVASLPTPGRENKFFKPVPATVQKTETKSENVDVKPGIAEVPSPIYSQNSGVATEGVDNSMRNEEGSLVPTVVFAGLILFCACFIYFFRRNKKTFSPGDDFKILEE